MQHDAVRLMVYASLTAGTVLGAASPASATAYLITPLVTDDAAALAAAGFGPAATIDPNLINPWGVSRSGTSPFWVSD
jgi:hypothetical protein